MMRDPLFALIRTFTDTGTVSSSRGVCRPSAAPPAGGLPPAPVLPGALPGREAQPDVSQASAASARQSAAAPAHRRRRADKGLAALLTFARIGHGHRVH